MPKTDVLHGIEWTPSRVYLFRSLLGENGRPLSRPKFAALFGGSERSIVRWEQGETRPLRTAALALESLARALLDPEAMDQLLTA